MNLCYIGSAKSFYFLYSLIRSPSRNILTFGNPYDDDMIIIPYIEMIIRIFSLINSKTVGKKVAGNAQEELTGQTQ